MAFCNIPTSFDPKSVPMITEREAATVLGMQHDTLRAWRRRKCGPAYHRFGREIRYSALDIEAFVQHYRIEHGGAQGNRTMETSSAVTDRA